jgi:plasmid maintenance system antidote protein VapI
MLESKRLGEELSQAEFARMLKISRQYLNDVEKGRRCVSPERASQWARTLGYSEIHWVKLALQDQVDRAGLKLRITGVEAA